jgi:hypothetical protein
MFNIDERRGFLRMPIDCSMTFNEHDDDRQHDAKVVNLSSKGILFTSRQRLEVGSVLDVVLTASHSDTPPMHARVEVTRVSSNRVLYEVACEIKQMGI